MRFLEAAVSAAPQLELDQAAKPPGQKSHRANRSLRAEDETGAPTGQEKGSTLAGDTNRSRSAQQSHAAFESRPLRTTPRHCG